MHTIARDLERLKELLPLQNQSPSLLWPSCQQLAPGDDQNAGTSPAHRRLRREGERSLGKTHRLGDIPMPASNLGMTGERFAQFSPRFLPLIDALSSVQWLLNQGHRGRRTAIEGEQERGGIVDAQSRVGL